MKKYIIVRLSYEGSHNWPDCNLMDVEFLRNTHRHLFYISIKKEIKHNNRDIEIIMFKRKIEKYLHDKYHHNFKSMSCEDICEDLIKEFSLSYCQVLEDNENGAEIWAE